MADLKQSLNEKDDAAGAPAFAKRKLRIIVAGSTGAIGKEAVVEASVRDEVESVTALVRKAGSWTNSKKIIEKAVDYEKLDVADFKGHDAIYLCLGARMTETRENWQRVDYHYALNAAKAAREAGVKHCGLVTGVMSDPNASNFYMKSKGELEEAIKKLGFEVYVIYRPATLEAVRDSNWRFSECCSIFFSRWCLCCCISCCCPGMAVINVRTVGLAMVVCTINQPKGPVVVYDGSDAIEAIIQRKSH